MNLGSNDFSKVIQTPVFIDKSIIIKSLIKDSTFIIQAPSGFGKSTNLNMIKRFFEIIVDEKGKPIDRKTTMNYKLFNDNNLNICQYNQFFDEHFGKYPLVYVDYGSLDVTSYENAMSSFTKIVKETYLPHKYLLRNSKLWMDDEKKVFSNFIETEEPLVEHDLSFALKYLCRLLHDHFKKKVYVLIDNYNNYVNDTLKEENPDRKDIIGFMRWINNDLLEINPFMNRAILTGYPENRIIKPRNLIKYHFLDKWYGRNFGLTESDIDKILQNVFKSDVKHIKELFDKEVGKVQSFDRMVEPRYRVFSTRDVLNFVKNNIK